MKEQTGDDMKGTLGDYIAYALFLTWFLTPLGLIVYVVFRLIW